MTLLGLDNFVRLLLCNHARDIGIFENIALTREVRSEARTRVDKCELLAVRTRLTGEIRNIWRPTWGREH